MRCACETSALARCCPPGPTREIDDNGIRPPMESPLSSVMCATNVTTTGPLDVSIEPGVTVSDASTGALVSVVALPRDAEPATIDAASKSTPASATTIDRRLRPTIQNQ